MANSRQQNTNAGGLVSSLAFTNPTIAGNPLVLAFAGGSAPANVTGTNAAEQWVRFGASSVGANGETEDIWGCLNAFGGAETVTWGVAAFEVAILEYPLAMFGALGMDVTPVTASGNGTAISTGNLQSKRRSLILGVSWNTTGVVTPTGNWVKDAETALNNELLTVISQLGYRPDNYAYSSSGVYANWEARTLAIQLGGDAAYQTGVGPTMVQRRRNV